MAHLSKVRVSGPLAEFASGFTAELVGLGYASRSVEAQLRLMNHVSVWLGGQGFSAGDLSQEVVGRFVVARRGTRSNLRSARALVPLLEFLRGRGETPVAVAALPVGPVEVVSEGFARYLSTQRGLAPATVASYVSQIRPFLAWYDEHHGGRWESLTAGHITRYMGVRAVGQRPRSIQVGFTALRVLLRWMWMEGLAPDRLVDVIGAVAAPTASGSLPKALAPEQVRDLLTGLSADSLAAARDEAMLALMWRMGLRAGEVAALCLSDIDWRVGVIVVRGKGDRHEQMPLPVDVGHLLAVYLTTGRPSGGPYRQVFLAIDAPHRSLGTSAVSSVVVRAAAKAGIAGPCAAHRLRHTAACQVLAGGGGLVEAGQLLRHASAAATAVYAKSDLSALTVLARPWPTGIQS
ncbi:MAG: tyrosine-type recombinase/integrase [Pseudonocardiaceae bacterium]